MVRSAAAADSATSAKPTTAVSNCMPFIGSSPCTAGLQGEGPARVAAGRAALSDRVERPAVLLLPSDADPAAGVEGGAALGVRDLDDEFVVTAEAHARAGVVP